MAALSLVLVLLSAFSEAKHDGGPVATLNNGVKMPLVGAGTNFGVDCIFSGTRAHRDGFCLLFFVYLFFLFFVLMYL